MGAMDGIGMEEPESVDVELKAELKPDAERASYPNPPNCARDGAADTVMSCEMSSTEPREIVVGGERTLTLVSDEALLRP